MFKIDSMQVHYINNKHKPTIYNMAEFTYIYGNNNVGKTLFVKSLDFVLGKSQDFKNPSKNLSHVQGMENIDYIVVTILKKDDKLVIKRNLAGDCAYHYDNDDFEKVNLEHYKTIISEFIHPIDKKELEIYYECFDENLTFRAFSFLNFLDEIGLGDLSCVFNRAKNIEHMFRFRSIMEFIFNHDNIVSIYNLKKEFKKNEEEIKKLKETQQSYDYFSNIFYDSCHRIGVDTKGDIFKIYEKFEDYKKDFNREVAKNNKDIDLNMLSKIAFELSEELKFQKSLDIQTRNIISRRENANKLLAIFSDLVKQSEVYSEYSLPIMDLINRNTQSNELLSQKDYKKTIKNIEKKKGEIDKQIKQYIDSLTKISYNEALTTIGLIEKSFNEIRNIPNFSKLEKLKERNEEIKLNIKKLNKSIDNKKIDEINKKFLVHYNIMEGKGIDFVEEDKRKNMVSVAFLPYNNALTGLKKKFENGQENESTEIYAAGSLARQTTWQIEVYLSMFELLIKSFSNLPVLPLLVIDGMYQPYDETQKFATIVNCIADSAKKLGVQLIITSTKDGENIEGAKIISLEKGFNETIIKA